MSQIDDQELIRRLRADLDQLVGDAGSSNPPELTAMAAQSTPPHGSSSRRWMAWSAAAATVALLIGGLVVIANRDAGDDVVATVPPVSTLPSTTSPGTTVPAVPPISGPATTVAPGEPVLYEAIGTVIDDGTGAQLCFSVLESLPPQCGTGPALLDWSWDMIDVEQKGGDPAAPVTWVDGIYVRVAMEPSTQELHTTEARIPTDEERNRLTGGPELDFSVPCDTPAGGWPGRNQEWPGDEVAAIDGYAGAWVDESQQVMTVKFTGDLATAQSALERFYDRAVCYVPAEHTEAELQAIQNQLMSMSSVQFSSVATYVDATGEWVQADIAGAPNAELQAALDAEFGEGVVRLSSPLHPIE
jgi:hypothetical protein